MKNLEEIIKSVNDIEEVDNQVIRGGFVSLDDIPSVGVDTEGFNFLNCKNNCNCSGTDKSCELKPNEGCK